VMDHEYEIINSLKSPELGWDRQTVEVVRQTTKGRTERRVPNIGFKNDPTSDPFGVGYPMLGSIKEPHGTRWGHRSFYCILAMGIF
jgi:hypothetical protein